MSLICHQTSEDIKNENLSLPSTLLAVAFKPDEEVEDSELIHSPCHRVGVSSVIITQRKNAKTKQKSLERKKEKKKRKKKEKNLFLIPEQLAPMSWRMTLTLSEALGGGRRRLNEFAPLAPCALRGQIDA